jgi:hypothetical protein
MLNNLITFDSIQKLSCSVLFYLYSRREKETRSAFHPYCIVATGKVSNTQHNAHKLVHIPTYTQNATHNDIHKRQHTLSQAPRALNIGVLSGGGGFGIWGRAKALIFGKLSWLGSGTVFYPIVVYLPRAVVFLDGPTQFKCGDNTTIFRDDICPITVFHVQINLLESMCENKWKWDLHPNCLRSCDFRFDSNFTHTHTHTHRPPAPVKFFPTISLPHSVLSTRSAPLFKVV